MSTEYKNILIEECDGYKIININRPEKLNALNIELLTELKSFFRGMHDESSKDGIIITGSGDKAFIAGADIAEMSEMTPDEANKFSRLGQDVTLFMENLMGPVIVGVNGFALGGGCEIAMSGDIILGTENSVFGQPEVKLGLIPGFGGTQRLYRYIGRQKARELIFTGRNVKSEEALNIGLCFKLFSNKEEMLNYAKDLMTKIRRNSPLAVGTAKRACSQGNELSITHGLQYEATEFSGLFDSHDMKEGTKAFLEKREPNFTGQ